MCFLRVGYPALSIYNESKKSSDSGDVVDGLKNTIHQRYCTAKVRVVFLFLLCR